MQAICNADNQFFFPSWGEIGWSHQTIYWIRRMSENPESSTQRREIKKINFCFTGMELWYLGGELRFQISGFTWTFPEKENVKEIQLFFLQILLPLTCIDKITGVSNDHGRITIAPDPRVIGGAMLTTAPADMRRGRRQGRRLRPQRDKRIEK